MTAKEKMELHIFLCAVSSNIKNLKDEGDSYGMTFHKSYIKEIENKIVTLKRNLKL